MNKKNKPTVKKTVQDTSAAEKGKKRRRDRSVDKVIITNSIAKNYF